LLALAWKLRRVPGLALPARGLAGVALWQFATGLGNVVLGWPLAAAVSHTGGAAALVLLLTWTVCATRRQAVQAQDTARLTLPELSR